MSELSTMSIGAMAQQQNGNGCSKRINELSDFEHSYASTKTKMVDTPDQVSRSIENSLPLKKRRVDMGSTDESDKHAPSPVNLVCDNCRLKFSHPATLEMHMLFKNCHDQLDSTTFSMNTANGKDLPGVSHLHSVMVEPQPSELPATQITSIVHTSNTEQHSATPPVTRVRDTSEQIDDIGADEPKSRSNGSLEDVATAETSEPTVHIRMTQLKHLEIGQLQLDACFGSASAMVPIQAQEVTLSTDSEIQSVEVAGEFRGSPEKYDEHNENSNDAIGNPMQSDNGLTGVSPSLLAESNDIESSGNTLDVQVYSEGSNNSPRTPIVDEESILALITDVEQVVNMVVDLRSFSIGEDEDESPPSPELGCSSETPATGRRRRYVPLWSDLLLAVEGVTAVRPITFAVVVKPPQCSRRYQIARLV